MRCKCCNTILDVAELDDDMCISCIQKSGVIDDDTGTYDWESDDVFVSLDEFMETDEIVDDH